MTPEDHAQDRWCIVVADDHGPEWALPLDLDGKRSPIQYCSLDGGSNMLQLTIRRASKLVQSGNILVTARDEYREYWEQTLWFVRTRNRFICDDRAASPMTTAAAIQSVAAHSPSSVITILPARCYVASEEVLSAALKNAFRLLPQIHEGVITLGMVDIEDPIDENYIIGLPATDSHGLIVHGFARRPTSWVAHLLREQGAMVASGILIGYAGVFAAHISKYWPGLTLALTQSIAAAKVAGVECEVALDPRHGISSSSLRALRWQPPLFTQRAIRVHRCGWNSLHSARSVAHISNFVARKSAFESSPNAWITDPRCVEPFASSPPLHSP